LTIFKRARQGSEPVRLGLCIIVQQGYQRRIGRRETLIVGRAKAAVLFVSYQLQPENFKLGKFPVQHFQRAIVRTIVHHNHFKGLLNPLLRK